MKKRVRYILIGLVLMLVLTIGGIIGYVLYAPNTNFPESSRSLYIPTGSSYTDLINRLESKQIVKDLDLFNQVASLKNFSTVRPGRYRIKSGMNNVEMVNLLRSGNQEAVLVSIDNIHTFPQLAQRLAQTLERDSAEFAVYFTVPSTASHFGFNTATFPCMFIAESYDFFWTSSGKDIAERMKKVYDAYWTDAKIQQAQAIGLTPNEVVTLASIVQSEARFRDEGPRIAGLYMNRLHQGIKLESDPTVKFAQQSFEDQRIYFNDLKTSSPYNTYMNEGLPPGPIVFVAEPYIESVLNYEKHDYIFMCAKADFSGYHNFSKTYEQHLIYANEYRKASNERGIR